MNVYVVHKELVRPVIDQQRFGLWEIQGLHPAPPALAMSVGGGREYLVTKRWHEGVGET